MNTCPFPSAAGIDPEKIPTRMRKLPRLRGFPVPWFVDRVNGEYDFRVMDGRKFVRAVMEKLCWVCGEPLGRFKTFVIGPMCGINRTSAEPPAHHDCAHYSAKNCPFLTRPNTKRREDEVTEHGIMAGIGLTRNPGVAGLWTVESYSTFGDGKGGVLFHIGEPYRCVEWYCMGRLATREEVIDSVASGMPLLLEQCDAEETPIRCKHAAEELISARHDFEKYLPSFSHVTHPAPQ
ncbi:MAG: hypothetical protein H0U18_03390 [Pyrinomonadaceae bacterium]|nr:hypothetical protein [Pyrinomonadaceae bacterium]